MRRQARNAGKIRARIETIPFAGVVLALLTIFMVIPSQFRCGLTVQLPQTDHARVMPEAEREDALIVSVFHDGKIFFGTQQVAPEDLVGMVKERLVNTPDHRVYIKADARVRYRSVAEVVNSIQAAGVNQVGLLTERSRKADLLL